MIGLLTGKGERGAHTVVNIGQNVRLVRSLQQDATGSDLNSCRKKAIEKRKILTHICKNIRKK